MGNSAYIRDITSLEELRIAIARFCEESENQIPMIDSRIQSRKEYLKTFDPRFQEKMESAQADLNAANSALAACEANTYEDEDGNTVYPNCDYEKEKVIECRHKLAIAGHNYSEFKSAIGNLESSINDFQKPKVKYRTFIQFEKEAATGSLKQLINGAEDYLSVSSPNGDSDLFGFGLTEAVAKMDPTMILAATVAIAEIIFMSVFAFLGIAGDLFSVSNKEKDGQIITTYSENGSEYICSALKIEKRSSGNYGKILNVNIPPNLKDEKIGKYLIQNLEANCRANNCKEIYGWANEANIPFYKELGYETRNEIKGTGSEVFKPLNSEFSVLQQNAKAAFENVINSDFSGGSRSVQEVNPLMIITPADFNDMVFWKQHEPEGMPRYMGQIDGYLKSKEMIDNGKTFDEIRRSDFKSSVAYENFIHQEGGDTIRLHQSGNYFQVDGGGRHRIAAAQLYYLKTGKIIPLKAEVSVRK